MGSPGGGEEEDLLAATQGQLRRVKVENVNYAKRAKRVDVKRLKDAIWKELEGVVVRVEEVSLVILSRLDFLATSSEGERSTSSIQRMTTDYEPAHDAATDGRILRPHSTATIYSLAIISQFPFHNYRLDFR